MNLMINLALLVVIPFWYVIHVITWIIGLTQYRSYDSMDNQIRSIVVKKQKSEAWKNLPASEQKKAKKMLDVNEFLRILRKPKKPAEVIMVDFEKKRKVGHYKIEETKK